MPCNCDHMEPSIDEIKMSKVACLLDEFNGVKLNRNHWNGMHPRVYNQTYDRYAGDFDKAEMVQELVGKIQTTDVAKCSLEMQIWWRDYQERHNMKVALEQAAERQKAKRAAALKKLTPEDVKALCL